MRLCRRGLFRRAGAAAVMLPLGACSGWQSALDPQGPGAAELARLFWLFLAVSGVVWSLVMAALVAALWRRRRAMPRTDPLAIDPRRERRRTLVVGAAVGATALTVLGLTGISYLAQDRIGSPGTDELVIEVTGHQWWWQVEYQDPRPDRTFTTANEIHIPTGRPVRLTLRSADVIHSFWVPNLMGKMDLVPGKQNQLRLSADRPGTYRGQCAEFCGLQHARMALLVIAEPPAAFEAWRETQIAAASPDSPARQSGLTAFLSSGCGLCHTIRGTPAGGRLGPDLTHVGGRRTIAAGTLPMTLGHLAAWIADPQGVKPGARMPRAEIGADELNAVSAYLLGLK